MITSCEGKGKEVVVAHLVPTRAKIRNLEVIGMSPIDLLSARNGLLLAKGIEECFDKLQLSFCKKDDQSILDDNLYMKIWDDDIRGLPIFLGSSSTIGEFDGHRLVIGSHRPFTRALSFQAYTAYQRNKHRLASQIAPKHFGSPADRTCGGAYFSTLRTQVHTTFRQEIKEEAV